MPTVTARWSEEGRPASKAVPAADPRIIEVAIYAPDPNAPPAPRVPGSRTIARMREKAEAETRNAAAARQLQAQVQRGLRPLLDRLFAVDAAGLVLQGPLDGIGSTERMVRTLAPLAAGGRHLPAVLVAAGAWADEAALREALAALAPKLAAIGMRICCRKTGLRMAKVRPAKPIS